MPEAMQRGKSAAISAALHRVMQWGWLGALVAGVLVAVFAETKAQPKAPPSAGDDAPVLAADSALGEAMRAGDKAVARRLLSLQFTFVDADGRIHVRKDFLADLKGGAAAAAAPASDAKVRLYGLLAMVTGHRQSAPNRGAFFLDIWVKQKGTWRALLIQDVAIAAADAPPAAAAAPGSETKHNDCKNPCQAIPYRVRSPAEQDVINAFQAIEKAVIAHDAGEWGKHVADEFVRYRTGQTPVPKSGRLAMIERQKESNAAVTVGEVETMRLSVYGDGAAMIASQIVPDNSRPAYRAARVWVKRNGQWQMAISAQTDIK
jgi:hypothetical protein